MPVTRIQRYTRSCNENVFFLFKPLRANANKVTVSNVQRRSRRRNGLDDNFESFSSFSVHTRRVFQFLPILFNFRRVAHIFYYISLRRAVNVDMAPAAPFSPTVRYYTFGIISIIDGNSKQ